MRQPARGQINKGQPKGRAGTAAQRASGSQRVAPPPAQPPRRVEAMPTRMDNVRRLAAWWPVQLLVVALVLAGGWESWRIAQFQGHAVPGGIAVDTAGATGAIKGGMLHVDLPLAIYNNVPSPVKEVSLWVDVWACPSADASQADCRKLLNTRQELDTDVDKGGQAHVSSSYDVGAPEELNGAAVRIVRRVDAVRTQADIEAKSPL